MRWIFCKLVCRLLITNINVLVAQRLLNTLYSSHALFYKLIILNILQEKCTLAYKKTVKLVLSEPNNVKQKQLMVS